MQISRLVIAASHLRPAFSNYGLQYLRVNGKADTPPMQPDVNELVRFVEEGEAQGVCVLIYSGTVDLAAVQVLAAYLVGSFKWEPDYICSYLRAKLRPQLAQASSNWTMRLQGPKEQLLQNRRLDRLTQANTLANLKVEDPTASLSSLVSQTKQKPRRVRWLDQIEKVTRRPITQSLLRGK